MLKLLLVTHYMPPHHGGIERVAEDHAFAAADAGFDVVWIASRDPPTAPPIETTSWGVAQRLPCWNVLERRLHVPYPIWTPAARAAIAAAVADRDVVHVHDVLYPGTSLALAAASKRRIPTLLTQHVGFVPYRSRILEAVERLAYATIGRRNVARTSAVACINAKAAQWLARSCGHVEPTVYLPNGVDCDRFRPSGNDDETLALRRRLDLPVERRILLFVGRLVPRKGAQLLVAAAPAGCHVLCVGERGTIADDVAQVGVTVEVRPFVPPAILADLMRAADILALPSVGEGLPLVVQEAMASGLPAIVGDDPGYRAELDVDSVVLIPPTLQALRAALDRLLANPGERRSIGQRARTHALARWNRKDCRDRLLEVYRALAARTPISARLRLGAQ